MEWLESITPLDVLVVTQILVASVVVAFIVVSAEHQRCKQRYNRLDRVVDNVK